MGDRILLAHGGGGRLTRELVNEVILPRFGNPVLLAMGDSAVVQLKTGVRRMAFTTDSFVVQPLFFPGGDLGRLAICGTVNDLAAAGAAPEWISLALIIEEGLLVSDFERIMDSAAAAAKEAGVPVVAGDTKVVEKGAADGLYINTSGIGRLLTARPLSPKHMKPGDKVIVSGRLGDHGIAVVSKRAGIAFETTVESDVAPLNGLVAAAIRAAGTGLRCMRDPTRGGLAAVLNEFAQETQLSITLEERAVPVSDAVRGACGLLGYDVLSVANEGKMVFICAPQKAKRLLAALRAHALGKEAAILGEIGEKPAGRVLLRTAVGGTRIVDMPYGEQLPRIC